MAYEQLDKNTVAASGQLGDTELVRFYNLAGTGKRILLVGNSITLHGEAPQIGWNGEWGMAASCREKDYAHRLMAAFPDSAFCICQVAAWEQGYRQGSDHFADFQNAKAFQPQVIVCRFLENCPKKDFDGAAFRDATLELLSFLDPERAAKYLITTSFWQHPGDATMLAIAKELGAPGICLGDLGQEPAMRADGLFDHKGVAHHPGDLGMAAIADRIRAALEHL